MKKGCSNLNLLPYLVIGVLLLLLDFWVKAYVDAYIPLVGSGGTTYPYGGIPVFYDFWGIDFSIVHVMNRGAAWGAFSGFQDYLLYLRIAVIVGLLIYLFYAPKDIWYRSCLTLVIAGALGNVLDYFVYGHVVDMFYFVFWGYSYPVFNVADSAIFCGILGLIVRSLMKREHDRNRRHRR